MSQSYGYAPRLMQAREAARYLGVSESKFRSLDLQSKRSGGNRLWDLRDLDDYADRLEYDGEKTCESEIEEAAVAFRMAPEQAAA
ncbi:DNA-binding protein [Roseicyclus sp. F158]|uniref:DNA-binding protein n=1 Tax=Tropicimonas omnivorans TaxID=3075590 RepID=A0ABU3DF14_9RHOB|nr:DNA-binding protein [Roseicyclus sp. F158]MDT0682299.1 DNA-binding protein [Roseicyclus sp. F158]